MENRLVSFHYVLKNETGEVLDDSHGGEPLTYIEGKSQIIRGLEENLTTAQAGEKKHVIVDAAKAYGEYDEALVMEIPRDQFPKEEQIEVGDQFRVSLPGNNPKVFTVADISDAVVSVDGNHPLAGEALYFDIEVTTARPATEEEINAEPHGDECCDQDHGHEGHHHTH